MGTPSDAPARQQNKQPDSSKKPPSEREAASRPNGADASASGGTPDIGSLTDGELEALIVTAQAELDTRRVRQRDDFIAEMKAKAQALGMDAATVAALLTPRASRRKAGDKRSAVQPKYRNPANPAQTWAGRGAKPQWVQEALSQGKKLEALKIS